MVRIYNTLSGKKERFPKPRKSVRLFVCGPTVYDDAHIGHARTQLAFDAIVRYLRSQTWKLTYLQNITDIDDKIIARAKKENTNPLTLARMFEKRYYQDLKALGINQVNTFARATDHIPQIIKQIQTLIKKEYAYEIEREGIYFDIKKYEDYGKLARRTAIQAEDGVSRIDEASKKRNTGDFALWKFVQIPKQLKAKKAISYKLVSGEPAWPAPFGAGRPGWHIEDTAITEHFFGPQYDLHGGGLDLKFPHHEAEIAQQESASGKKPFVKIWMHAGLIRLHARKMSKSLGNFLTIRDFLRAHDPRTLRWIALSHHYRSPAEYSEELAKKTEAALRTLTNTLARLKFVAKNGSAKNTRSLKKNIAQAEKAFHAAMEDDFNTPKAIASIFTLTNILQKHIWNLPKKEAEETKKTIEKLLATLGFTLSPATLPKKVKELLKKRELSRRNKHFVQADAFRNQIDQLGYIVEDTPLGPLAHKK